jgi:hypothetical protein
MGTSSFEIPVHAEERNVLAESPNVGPKPKLAAHVGQKK